MLLVAPSYCGRSARASPTRSPPQRTIGAPISAAASPRPESLDKSNDECDSKAVPSNLRPLTRFSKGAGRFREPGRSSSDCTTTECHAPARRLYRDVQRSPEPGLRQGEARIIQREMKKKDSVRRFSRNRAWRTGCTHGAAPTGSKNCCIVPSSAGTRSRRPSTRPTWKRT
jgi:hypothetical protein